MMKSMRVGNTVICVIRSKMFQKTFETDGELLDLYEKALNTDETNDEEVISLMKEFEPKLTYEEKQQRDQYEKDVADAEKSKDLIAWMEDIKNLGDEHFRVEGLKLYMKGIDITVPEFLAREFASRRDNEEDLRSLQNFWRLCALNPDPRCREDLYKFLMNNNMVVTPSGYFLAYRNADVKEQGNQELNEFVGLQYTKIKNRKKSPKNNYIVEIFDGDSTEYKCVSNDKLQRLQEDDSLEVEYIGNLQDLYEELDTDIDATVYTDNWSGTTTIKIGSPVNIPRSECDSNPDRTCSKGLHLGNVGFMSKGSFGQVGLVCLCNPMNVVAVP